MSQEDQDLEEYTKNRFPQEYAMRGEKFKEDVKDTLGFQMHYVAKCFERLGQSMGDAFLKDWNRAKGWFKRK
jgi:hypothetical protein